MNTFDANNRDTIDEAAQIVHLALEIEPSPKQLSIHSFRNMESFGLPEKTYQHSFSGAPKE